MITKGKQYKACENCLWGIENDKEITCSFLMLLHPISHRSPFDYGSAKMALLRFHRLDFEPRYAHHVDADGRKWCLNWRPRR